MKSSILISVVGLSSLVIGLNQRSQLASLREESTRLTAAGPPRTSSRSAERNRSNSEESFAATRALSAARSIAEIEEIFVLRCERMAGRKPGVSLNPQEKAEAADSEKRLLECFIGLDHQAVFKLLERLRSNSNLADSTKGFLIEECVDYLQQSNPAGAIRLLLTFPDVAYRESRIIGAFYNWGSENPTQAMRWFEEESKMSNPVTKNPGMLKCVMLSQARIDPVRALARAQSDEVAAIPDSLSNLGASFAAMLRNAGEQRAFLAALRKSQENAPGSEVLAKIRTSYIRELSNKFHEWPFEEASKLMDSEMTQGEKIAAANNVSHYTNLSDPILWANWMLKLDAPPDENHPILGRVLCGATNDYEATGKWLEQVPPGALKNRMIVSYAWFVADRDPACAMRWAMSLAEGPQRKKIVRQVGEKWDEKDPSAAAAFAKEHDLPH